MQTTGRKSGHFVVFREGKYYKVDGYQRGRLVTAKQLEKLVISSVNKPIGELTN